MIDMHCHIVFGVDDGAKTIEQSLQMLKEARQVRIYQNHTNTTLYGTIL